MGGFFIFGLPAETKLTMMKTIQFSKELDPDIAKFHILVPYPGTEIYDRWRKRLIIKKWEDLSLFSGPVFIPENFTVEDLIKFYKFAFKKFYLRPSFALKKILHVTKHPNLIKDTILGAMSVMRQVV